MMRKKVFGLFVVLFVFSWVGQVFAADPYQLLVPIPGMSSTDVSIGSYMTGLYHFLLAIVGIVAMIRIILGGFKYIGAAGNPSVASDAKDMIFSAAIGLILAILSWVLLISINPDLRFIRQPGAEFANTGK